MRKNQNNMSEEEKAKLKLHRERLRNRYLTQNHDDMDDSRMLELLITYAIPRIDVYPHSVALLAKFGDLDNVLSASEDDLCTVDGIGPSTAILITLVKSILRRANITKNNRKVYKGPEDIVKYFCKMFDGIREERMMIVAFNNSFEMLSHDWISKGHPDECLIDMREVARVLVRDNVSYVAFAHNHPNGNVKPSVTDIETMFKLKLLIDDMSVKLIDMFVVSDDKYFKMSEVATLADRMGDYSDEEFSYTFGNTVTYEAAELAEAVIDDYN
ncbi:MAG: RadC family protein [Clostridia bacterium]|nr:RadC family protein [Clostridia bacterium]